jgi:hypothetical protein
MAGTDRGRVVTSSRIYSWAQDNAGAAPLRPVRVRAAAGMGRSTRLLRPPVIAAADACPAIAGANLAAGACDRGSRSLPDTFVVRANASARFGHWWGRRFDWSGRLRVARAPAEHECERAAAENRRAKNDQTPAELHFPTLAHEVPLGLPKGRVDPVDANNDATNAKGNGGDQREAQHGQEATPIRRELQAWVAGFPPVAPSASRPWRLGSSKKWRGADRTGPGLDRLRRLVTPPAATQSRRDTACVYLWTGHATRSFNQLCRELKEG